MSIICRMTCLSPAGPYIVVWKKNRRVISAREAIVSRDTRYSLVDGYSLRIASVRPSDQSSYTCSLDTEPLTELTHQLVVLCEYRAELFAAIEQLIPRE